MIPHRPNFGQALGPVLGGILAYYAGWPWIFWLLAIMGALCFVLQLIFFPETCRNIVGNGSLEGGRLNKPLFPLLSPLNTEHQITDLVGSKEEGVKTSTRKARIPNPLNSLKLIFRRHNALVLVANALFYLSYSCFQAALSPLIMRIYGLNALQSGLCYVPYGISSILSSYITGNYRHTQLRSRSHLALATSHIRHKLTRHFPPLSGKVLDLDYRQTALRHGFAINTSGGDDIATYPIEEARIRSVIAYIIFGVVATIAFGWIIAAKVHLSVPLIITVVLAFSYTGTLNVSSSLASRVYALAYNFADVHDSQR